MQSSQCKLEQGYASTNVPSDVVRTAIDLCCTVTVQIAATSASVDQAANA